MAEITLRAYSREIDDLIEHEQLDEAIAHCRHILQTFPKHLQTYRLLGKAYVEAKRYGDAADLFQRVLSSVPDDFVAHVGMSIVREDEGNLDAAIWHMERAYETNPAHPAIQQELRKLIGRRDGLEPHKARLTRGALARMYAQGELFAQGVAELRAALKEDPDRPDLQVLLADMYWRLDQRVEAIDVCNRILEKLPYCLEANRIMASIFQAQGRMEEAATFVRRLAALDPYAAFAESSANPPEDVDAGLVRLEKLSWQRGQAAPSGPLPRPEWAAPMGMDLREKPTPGGEAPLPSWLQPEETTQATAPKPEPAKTPPAAPAPAREPAAAAAEIPGWMREVGWAESSGQVAEAPVSFSDEELQALESGAAPAGDRPLAPAEIPGWLKDIAPDSLAAASSPAFAPGGAGGDEELPPWLDEIVADVSQTTPKTRSAEGKKETSAVGRAPVKSKKSSLEGAGAQEAMGPTEPIEERVLPPWLEQETPGATSTIVTWLGDRSLKEQGSRKSEGASTIPAPSVPPPTPAAPAQATPTDWLSGLRSLGETEPPAEELEGALPEAAAAPGGGPPPAAAIPGPGAELDWLRNLTSGGKDAGGEAAGSAGGEVPGWLTVPYEEMPEQFEKASDEGRVPTGAEEAVPASGQEEMAQTFDWLRGFEAPEPEPAAEPSRKPSWIPEGEPPVSEAEPEPDLVRASAPDWLQELARTVEGAPAVPEAVSETPDWLKGVLDETPAEAKGAPEGAAVEPVSQAAVSEPVPSEPSAAEGVPEWLRGLTGAELAEAAPIEPSVPSMDWLPEPPEPAAELAAGQGVSGIEPPSWERIAKETTAEAEVPEPLAMGETPDWLKELSRPPEAPVERGIPAEIPGWVEPPEEISAAAEEPLAMGETPDWLRELVEPEGKPAVEAVQPEQPEIEAKAGPELVTEAKAEEAAVPSGGAGWLESFEEPATTPSARPSEEAPDWLAEFADKEAVSGEATSWLTEETPWAMEAVREGPPPRAPAEAPSPGSEEEVPEWLLRAVEEPTRHPPMAHLAEAPEMAGVAETRPPGEMEGEGAEDAEIFQWLEDLAARQEAEEGGAQGPTLAAEALPAEEAVAPEAIAWMGEEPTELPLEEGVEESPVWLQELAQEGELGAQGQVVPSEGELTPEEVSEVPDWLLSMEAELAPAPAPEKLEPPELPIWLEMPEVVGPVAEETAAQPEVPAGIEKPAIEMAEAIGPEFAQLQPEPVQEEMPEVLSFEIEELGIPVPPEIGAKLAAAEAPEVPMMPEAAAPIVVPVPEEVSPPERIEEIPVTQQPILVAEPAEPAPRAPAPPPTPMPVPAPRKPVKLEEMLASEPPWLKPVAVPQAGKPSKAELGVADWLLLASRKTAAPAAPPGGVMTPKPAPRFTAARPPVEAELPGGKKAVSKPKITQAGASDLLNVARKALDTGDIPQAVEKYGLLIRRKLEVQAVIQDLRAAVGRSPRAAPLWQALGDAYMKGNQVAEAVEAYRHGMEAA